MKSLFGLENIQTLLFFMFNGYSVGLSSVRYKGSVISVYIHNAVYERDCKYCMHDICTGHIINLSSENVSSLYFSISVIF